jgi:hypothetical protein
VYCQSFGFREYRALFLQAAQRLDRGSLKVKIDSEVYQGVMREILHSIRHLHANTDAWLFVQDGAPSHTSRSSQEFLARVSDQNRVASAFARPQRAGLP